MASQSSLLLSVPAEIRLHIYSFLLNDGNEQWLQVRNKPPYRDKSPKAPAAEATGQEQKPQDTAPPRRRSSTTYHVMERTSMFHRRCHKTTYYLAPLAPAADGSDTDEEGVMHVAILSVCRQTYHEGSEALYGRHGFDFGTHIEAVVPFLQDRTPYTASLLRTISVHKLGPMPCLGSTSEHHEWSYMCRFLASALPSSSNTSSSGDDGLGKDAAVAVAAAATAAAATSSLGIKKLRLQVEAGRPSQRWRGVQRLTESDIRLLSQVGGHDVLDWAAELAQVKGLERLEVVVDEKYLPEPKSPAMALYAALSASIENGLTGFLRSEMRVRSGS